MTAERNDIEQAIRQEWSRQNFDEATTIAIREYGPEILGVLAALMRSESDANEVFSIFCEDLWRGLPRFRWQCTARVWAYTLARHAANRYATSAHRKPERNLSLSKAERIRSLVQEVRTTTLPHLRTEVKQKVRTLREQLPVRDQELLILRVDKRLSWRDIAMIAAGEAEGANEEELETSAVRLRKRFHKAKAKLKRLAQDAGITGRRE